MACRFAAWLLAALLFALPASAQMLIPNTPLAHGLYMSPAPVFANLQTPLANGLSLLYTFDQLRSNATYVSRGRTPLDFANGAILGPLASGSAIMSDAGSPAGAAFNQSTVSYTLPTSGTILVFLRANFAPTDSISHMMLQIGTGPGLYMLKHSDNNWYIGFFGSSFSPDARVAVAATGTYNTGEAFVVAITYGGSLTTAYVKGVSIGTNATSLSGIIPGAGVPFSIGCTWNGSTLGACWSSAMFKDGIHYVAVIDRILGPKDISTLSANPSQLLTTNNDRLMWQMVGAAAPPPPATGKLFFMGSPF